MTCCSCIASSSAACVFGGVRLISSASTMLANSGPGRKRNCARAGALVFLNDFGAGDVGRHQVGRELDAVELERQRIGQRADHQRLRQAGHADEQAMAAGEERDEQLLDHLVLADDAFADFVGDAAVGFAEALDGLRSCGFGHEERFRGRVQDRAMSKIHRSPS